MEQTQLINNLGSIQGAFFSENRGQGKTIALVSYYRHGLEHTRRLLLDKELRARTYRSPDNQDHPEALMWAFDFFHDAYDEHMEDGELTAAAFAALYRDIKDDTFDYDALLIDNAAMLQDDLLDMIRIGGKAVAKKLAEQFGVYQKLRATIEYRFKPSDNTVIYQIVKAILSALLRLCRKRDIDVICATEKQNKWKDYGTRDMKVVGQTAKLLEPFMQYADFSYRLTRTKGSRDEGTAKLIPVPWAILDNINPKNSIPGLKPQFEMTWANFWMLALARGITTQADLDEVVIEKNEATEYEPTREEQVAGIKDTWIATAIEKGIIKDRQDATGISHLIALLADTYATINAQPDLEHTQAEGITKINEYVTPPEAPTK